MRTVFVKCASGLLVPAYPEEFEKLDGLRHGLIYKADLTAPRNPLFHRKGMMLFKTAFDLWSERVEARVWRGREIRPEFERFRKDLTVMSGFFRPVFNIRGEPRLEAESLAWGSMDEVRFGEVYSAVLDTALAKIVPHVKRNDVENAIERILAFT